MRSTARRPEPRSITSGGRQDSVRRWVCAAIALAMLAISGCATVAPPPGAQVVTRPTAAQLAHISDAIKRRDREIESMRTEAVMEYRTGDHSVKAREEIVVRRPANLRVDAFTPFSVALVVAAHAGRLQIFEPSKNTLLSGNANAATLARFARIPMAPSEAVRLLMGIAPEGSNSGTPISVTTVDGVTVLTYREANGNERDLGFQDDQLALVRERLRDGTLIYDVHYSDYHDIGGVKFPYVVEANFPLERSHVTFRYSRPIINGKLPDSLFVLKPGPGTKRIDIGMAGGSHGVAYG